MKKILTLVLSLVLSNSGFGQEKLLESGPMVGYSTMKEVLLWVKTKQPAEVKFQYWNVNDSSKTYSTESTLTTKSNQHIAKLVADTLEPGQNYEYTLYINNQKIERPYRFEFQTQPLWQWRTDPPAFTFALGSCNYVNTANYDRPGKPYGGDYRIFNSITTKDPDFMLWLGDNVYLREPDWNSRTGIMSRYAHTRALPEMQRLMASTHNYAIWDDHDYGPNDSDKTFWNKKITEESL